MAAQVNVQVGLEDVALAADVTAEGPLGGVRQEVLLQVLAPLECPAALVADKTALFDYWFVGG